MAVNKSGVIQYMNNTNYTDNGCKINEPVVGYGYDVYHNVYDVKKINYAAYNCVTDTAKNTFCRSPGNYNTIKNLIIFNINVLLRIRDECFCFTHIFFNRYIGSYC